MQADEHQKKNRPRTSRKTPNEKKNTYIHTHTQQQQQIEQGKDDGIRSDSMCLLIVHRCTKM